MLDFYINNYFKSYITLIFFLFINKYKIRHQINPQLFQLKSQQKWILQSVLNQNYLNQNYYLQTIIVGINYPRSLFNIVKTNYIYNKSIYKIDYYNHKNYFSNHHFISKFTKQTLNIILSEPKIIIKNYFNFKKLKDRVYYSYNKNIKQFFWKFNKFIFSHTLFQFLHRWDLNLFNKKLKKHIRQYTLNWIKKINNNIIIIIYNKYNICYKLKLLIQKQYKHKVFQIRRQFWLLKYCFYFFSLLKTLDNTVIFQHTIRWILDIYQSKILNYIYKWNIKWINVFLKQFFNFNNNLYNFSFINILFNYKLLLKLKFLLNIKITVCIWLQQYLNLNQILKSKNSKIATFLLFFIQLKFLWRNNLLLNILILYFIILTYINFYTVAKILGTYFQMQLRVLFSKNEQKYFLYLFLKLTKFFIVKKPLSKYAFYNHHISSMQLIITGRWQRKRWVTPFPKKFTEGKVLNLKYLNSNLIISYFQGPIFTRKGNIGLKLFLVKKINNIIIK